jgi:hypothetical protein
MVFRIGGVSGSTRTSTIAPPAIVAEEQARGQASSEVQAWYWMSMFKKF